MAQRDAKHNRGRRFCVCQVDAPFLLLKYQKFESFHHGRHNKYNAGLKTQTLLSGEHKCDTCREFGREISANEGLQNAMTTKRHEAAVMWMFQQITSSWIFIPPKIHLVRAKRNSLTDNPMADKVVFRFLPEYGSLPFLAKPFCEYPKV